MKNTDSYTLTPEQKSALIARLVSHVTSECPEVDMEERFCRTIDEIYSFKDVGGPFAYMTPSDVLREMSPTDFRMGVADQSDRENVYEIGNAYYDADKVEDARMEFLMELSRDLDEAREEQEELAAIENHDTEELAEVQRNLDKIEQLEEEIREVENYSF